MPNKRIKVSGNPFTELPPIRPNKDQRQVVLARYARCGSDGIPIRCMSSPDEIAERKAKGWAPLADKVIFPDLNSAIAASRALAKLGMDKTRAYVCERSDSGHAHLTRKAAS